MKGPIRFARTGDVQPDINVTPLVDVVLVLLIIFMVVAPRLNQEVPVDLPGIFNPDPDMKGVMDPLKVTVAKAGEYYIDDQVFTLDGATAYLESQHEAAPGRRLALRGDAKLTYKDVRDIFARCQQVGFPGMSLLVGQRHKRDEAKVVGAGSSDAAGAIGGEASGSSPQGQGG